ncbi:S8 family serine peptidase [Pedobacter sp. JY14-1]|uniref:S8 family serine peptidase n=1 Tax=Pedobacter sp. JY14-1 TaxID=3034151 RepID=UPI0023E2D156|nr:S8 family serine peptidase [Pedobacter sp. JY14-1]
MKKPIRPSGKAVNDLRRYGPALISERSKKTERLLSGTYRKDQILVFFRRKPTADDILVIRKNFERQGYDTSGVRIRTCGNCEIPVQLWSAKGIHTWISKDSLKAGSGPASTTVGEHYALNFLNDIPAPGPLRLDGKQVAQRPRGDKQQEIIIAVLDTGVDTSLVSTAYLWQQEGSNTPGKCYQDVKEGWNFVSDQPGFHDDNPARHGSLVSQYIVNQFTEKCPNRVKIMPLKTHDKDGRGDLYSTICAINFAIAKGAHIINASWGFYYYYVTPIPYIKELITGILRKKGILFVTAAGNRVEANDQIARKIYELQYGVILTDEQLRDLAIHHFYPADLSTTTNNVITVTTTDGRSVSPSQNHSSKFADLGVIADQFSRASGMGFKVPFGNSGSIITGSSFATAIASGVIGAWCPKSLYVPALRKKDFLSLLQTLPSADGSGGTILQQHPALAGKYIKNGSCIK